MSTKPTPTGYVPVTIHLPADLAARFHEKNYNWNSLTALFISSFTARELTDYLLDLYFDYSRLLVLNTAEITPDSAEQLYALRQVISAISDMASEPESR